MSMSTAAAIVDQLRANGFTAAHGDTRQVLNLVEEAGELVGAYRRWAGLARRSGTAQEMHAELADVVITAYVTAAELGIDLDAALTNPASRTPDPLEPHRFDRVSGGCRAVLAVALAVTRFMVADLEGRPCAAASLARVVSAARAAGLALAVDLDAAVASKLAVVFSRGWREPVEGVQL
jgi:NTP pyrophosphatase (non-canonical NTP hydrolase)